MAKNIITIGFELPGHSDLCHAYSTNQSLLDADVIIFEPDFDSYSLDSYDSHYNGKCCYDKNDSFRLQEDTSHWKKELSTALGFGKTVFVFFKKFEDCYIHTGQKQFSGTGRNTRTTNIVTGYHNYNFFPVDLPTIIPKEGKEIVFNGNSVFSPLWKEFQKYFKYESYLDGKVLNPIFLTKTGDKIIGALFNVGAGNLVLLPPLFYDEKKFVKYDQKKKQNLLTKDALKFGNRLLQILIDIDKMLKEGGDKTPLPEWAAENNFELVEENQIKSEIEKNTKQIDKLVVQKNEFITKLDEAIKLKNLLFEKGKILENAIITGLEILGYKAENYNDGNLELDQVIISPDGERFIGEAEGKDTSAINIDKFRQLASNIQEDLQREEVGNPATGILFGNGYRLTKPSERAEQFTDKCINTAKSSNCILIRTTDLFRVVKFIKESNDQKFAKNCRDIIKNSVGKIVNFPEISVSSDQQEITEMTE